MHIRVKIHSGIIFARNVELFGDEKIKGKKELVFFLFSIKGVINFGLKIVFVVPFKNTAHNFPPVTLFPRLLFRRTPAAWWNLLVRLFIKNVLYPCQKINRSGRAGRGAADQPVVSLTSCVR
jgi:hypothetical protein